MNNPFNNNFHQQQLHSYNMYDTRPPSQRGYVPQYNIPFFNDIHNYFPAILYEHERFTTITSLLGYIRDQVRHHSDAFLNAQREYRTAWTNEFAPMPVPMRAPAPAAAPPVFQFNTDQQFINSLLNIFTQPELTLMTAGVINLPEPVVISPSSETLAHASDILTASADHSSIQCIVCLEHLVAGQELRKMRFCQHIFHRSCIDTWFERTVRCPICRHDIRDDLSNNDDEEYDETHNLNDID